MIVASAIVFGCMVIAYVLFGVGNEITGLRGELHADARKLEEHLATIATKMRRSAESEREWREQKEAEIRQLKRDLQDARTVKPGQPGVREFRS